ncbi:MAG TPA: NAD-dependent epimerase/dehydratase family protein [Myxococcota bacterium]
MSAPQTLLVVGATGTVGTALVQALVAAGHTVRAAARRGSWPLDVDDADSVRMALDGVDAAYWLVHGLKRGGDYPAWERRVAEQFGALAHVAGIERVVYLGGLLPAHSTRHLDSRAATGRALASAGVDVVELRAGVIIGAGSESFTLARDTAARLPIFLAPPWLSAPQQPVALDDVVAALVHALAMPTGIYDVPGPEIVTSQEIVQRIARLLGRKSPRFIPIPMMSKALAGRIAPFVTRANASVAHELFLGMGIDFSVRGDGVFAHMPRHRRLSLDEAITRALASDDVSLPAQLFEATLRSRPRRRHT